MADTARHTAIHGDTQEIQMQLREGPKPRGCPLLLAKVAAAVTALLLIWLVIS